MIRVSELYGPVSQGEGVLLGERMPFVRVAGCNLSCSWCDSSYTWKVPYTYTEMSPEEIIAALDRILESTPCHWVSITGGEPTLYDFSSVIRELRKRNIKALVETNGLRVSPWLMESNVLVSCSPKLRASEQDTPLRRNRIKAFVARRAETLSVNTQYKFVITNQQDLDDFSPYCRDVGIPLSSTSSPVYLQPDGYIQPLSKYLETLSWLQENAPQGARVTPQVHRLVHGPDKRGI